MSNPSNLYAEKIYSEHPLVLWALDDKVDYIGLISEQQRNIVNSWTVDNGSTSLQTEYIKEPFPDSVVTLLEVDVPSENTTEASLISSDIINLSDLLDSSTFAIGAYIYSDSNFLQSISIGYEYTDPDTESVVQVLKTFTTTFYGKWAFLSETFETPNIDAELRLVIKVTVIEGSSLPSENSFYINGITLGQLNEEFNTNSYGINKITIPGDVSVYGGSEAVEAQAYGIAEDSGYYIIDNNKLTCKNTSMPLVYGASGVTKLIPNDIPQLILPGKGFLNKKGQYNDYTVEFWARINSTTSSPFKIFGPINSDDGIYVENGFLTVVINNNFASYFVSEWSRPMLIHLRIIKNSASLLLNGEQVISLSFNTDDLVLPNELDELGKNQDWIYFASSENICEIEIDCVAIYSYQVPTIVAKRRWVYGQGVASPESINSSYNGTTAFIDYPFANYSVNYNYPDFAKWDQGSFDNLSTTTTSLRTPEYSLPEISIGNKTIQNLYNDNKNIQESDSGALIDNQFLSFRPNNTWNSINSYINFPKFNLLSSELHSLYGVFSISDLSSDQILFKIYNELNSDYFLILKNNDVIEYSLNYNGINEVLHTTDEIGSNTLFSVGFDINKISNRFGNNVSSFFGNTNNLKMYVAGDNTGQYSFTGKVYSIGFSTELNSTKNVDNFDDEGFVFIDNGQDLIDYTASYTLLPSIAYDKYFLDIGVAGYWEDYLPLSYFAQFVRNKEGEIFYDLDFLQFNVGYPAVTSLVESQGSSDLYYNTENSQIKSYITFQPIVDGANNPIPFTNQQELNEYKVIDVNNNEDWLTTRFEILNNTLVYPNKTTDFNSIAIVYSLEFNSRGILTKPLSLNTLQIASQSFNDNSSNPVGTRFGVDLFPYKKTGIYYNYKAKNPFSIYKESTPYLYLTENSGIAVRGEFNPLENRGLSLPINKEMSNVYSVSAMQIWARYDKNVFPQNPIEVFEINYKDKQTIKFYLKANSSVGDRGTIYALNQNGIEYNGLSFYLNGNLVKRPVLSLREWASIGISFASPLRVDSYLGSINITGPLLFNNISYYQGSSLREIESSTQRPWIKVLTDGLETFDWLFWDNNFSWDEVLILESTEFYGINPTDIYKTYIGTNKIIIDDGEGLVYQPEKLKIYTDIEWQTSVLTPV
jgi:hypothetical protein